jgi:hypothetical protein
MFAQLMSEMLTPTAFESFRVFSLGTIARLDEALDLIENVARNRIPRAALEPPLAELAWSLTKDPVVGTLAQAAVGALSELTSRKDYSLSDLRAHLVLIKRLLSALYKGALEAALLNTFADPQQRILLRQATGFYCSHLINLGYSKPYIAEQVDRLFFQKPMLRIGKRTLSRFFRLFDGKERKFIVYAALDDQFGKFALGLKFNVQGIENIPTHASRALQVPDNVGCGNAVLANLTQAHDEYAAMIHVHELIGSLRALTYLDPFGFDAAWGKVMYVARQRAEAGTSYRKQEFSFERQPPLQRRGTARSYRNITQYAQRIIRSFDEDSFGRVLSSINTYALARQSSNSESQLTSLWSSVEVLLSEPPQGETRIVHYSKLLVPCVCLRYVRRQTIAVYDEMLISYRRQFARLVARDLQFPAKDPHTRFAAVLYMEENKDLRRELCDLCAANPLALHRLWKLYRDFSSAKSILDAVTGHEQRVYWQICRIYRARNRVVHAGDVPSIMDSLVLNAAEYFVTAIAAIINRANRQQAPCNIDQVVSEIGIEYRLFQRHFEQRRSKGGTLSSDDLLRLVA